MILSYRQERQDYVTACTGMARKTRWCLFAFWCALVLFSFWMNPEEVLHGSSAARLSFALPLLFCGLIFLSLLWWSPRWRARSIVLRPVTWDFSDDCIRIDSEVANATVQWAAFVKYRETPKVFLLYIQKSQAQFIPKRVLTPEQITELRTLLDAHIPRK